MKFVVNFVTVLTFFGLAAGTSLGSEPTREKARVVQKQYRSLFFKVAGVNSLSTSKCDEQEVESSFCVFVGFKTRADLERALPIFGNPFELDGVQIKLHYQGEIVVHPGIGVSN